MADSSLVERILAVIRSTESGGNYAALNTSEPPNVAASGAYQMIGSTWRNWAAQAGVDTSIYPTARDAPPEVQDLVARHQVGLILDQNGGNPDAVWGNWYYPAWYQQGRLDEVPPGANSKTLREYIAIQNDKLAGGAGTVSAASARTTEPGIDPETGISTDPEVVAFLQAVNADPDLLTRVKFPQWSMYLSDPELGPILRDAAKGGWDQTRLVTAIQATNWWRTTSDAARNWDAIVAGDPGRAEREREDRITDLATQFSTIGFTPDRAQLVRMAEDSLRGGWDSQRITQAIVAALPEQYGAGAVQAGDVSGTMADLRASAASYFMPLTDQTAYDWAKRIAAGTMTDQGVKAQMLDWAKTNWSWMAPQLDQGQTVEGVFRPMRETIASIMGTAPDAIDLMTDSYWRQVTGVVDAQGARRAPTIQDAETLARAHPNWRYTADAQNRTAGIASDLLNVFTGS